MSIEASVDELYGDSKDDKWKEQEVARLKAEQGVVEVKEPAVNLDGLDISSGKTRIEEGMNNAGQSVQQGLQDEQGGISGSPADS